MSNLKKQMKRMKKQQRKLEQIIKLEQSLCPHVGKSFKSKLGEPFKDDNGIVKAQCDRCGDIVIVDSELLSPQSVATSADIIKTVLAELRSKVFTKKMNLDSSTIKLISSFDAEVLRELPKLMEQMLAVSGDGKKKKKKKGKQEKKRQRFS
jgi:hypothetical protein